MMWIYLVQSVIIGFFNVLKMLKVAFSSNSAITALFGLFFAGFFVMHYGGFHAGYAFFLFAFGSGAMQGVISEAAILQVFPMYAILLGATVFFINHLFSFMFYLKETKNKENDMVDLSNLMFAPYPRIIPMHLTIIFGGILIFAGLANVALIIFMVLKIWVDLKMHINEHKGFFGAKLKKSGLFSLG